MANPLQQFEIVPLALRDFSVGGVNLAFTNSSLFMTAAIALVIGFFTLSMRHRALVPARWQAAAEMAYGFIANTVRDNIGNAGRPYFPFIFSLFMFVLCCNLLGMMPYSFTVTSHISVTFALALFIFLSVTLIAIVKHKGYFFSHFLPAGTPWWLAPLMVLIEVFAYLARPLSLSVRLAANMTAGHTMLKVIAGFVIPMGILGGWAPLLFLMVLSGFEIFVAVLQAYIFTVLTCVYLNEAIHLH